MAITSTSLKVWRDEIGRRMLNLDFKPLSDDQFRSTMIPLVDCDGVRAVRFAHTPGLSFRDSQLVKDGSDTVSLVVNLQNKIEVAQRGRVSTLYAGDAAFLENFQVGHVGSTADVKLLSIILPSNAVQLASGGREKVIASRIQARNRALRLLKAYLAGLPTHHLASNDLQKIASRHVSDLVKFALAEEAEQKEIPVGPSAGEARLAIATDFIAQNFRNAELSLLHVAANQNVSPRYLEKLFEMRGIRYVEHVSALRLAEALRLLTDRSMTDRTVTDIALACGFSDISHFNRMFRRRFGASPTAMRTQHD